MSPHLHANCEKAFRTWRHWRRKSSLQEFLRIRHSSIEFLLNCAAKLLLMWMMALEIELHHTESIDTLCGLKIQNLCCHSRTNSDWTRSSRSLLKFVALTELKFPSTTTKGRNSWVVVCRGKNHFLDELPQRDPGHNPTSEELLVEKSIAKDSEHCATELDQSRIEKTHAQQSKIPTDPVYYSKEVTIVGIRKWDGVPACGSCDGDSLSTKVPKLVMRFVRRYDHEMDGVVHWKFHGAKTAKRTPETWREEILGHGLASTHS